MASSYTDIGTELMATGENAGTWGTKTNTNIQILEEAINGYVSQALTSSGTVALTYTDGSTGDVARHAVIALTGTITGNAVVTVPANEKVWIIDNQSSGAYTVTVKVSGQTGVTWGTSDKGTKILYANGTDVVDTNIGGGVGAQDLNGEEFILDADADTSITADTDDQIDIKIAGADDFQFTANTFTAQSGSSIVVPDGGLTFGSTAIAATAAELNIVDGGTSATSTTVADADRVVLNDNGTMVQVAVTDLAAYFDDEITTMPNLTSVGTLTTLTVDDITIDSSTISDSGSMNITSGSSLTIDVDGTIVLDAGSGGNGVQIKDDGTEMFRISNSSSDVTIESKVSDKDLFIKGNDGGSTITALTFDMSDAGKATFSGNVVVTGDLTVSGDDITMGTNTAGNLLIADGTNFNSIAVGDLSAISTVAADDVLMAVDTSGGGLKKITRSALVSGLAAGTMSNIVEDTSPQLGGDLDMNGQDIVTTSNATIDLAANGTGTVVVRGNTNSGRIVFNCESNSHGQTLASQPHSAAVTNTMLLPAGSNSTLVSLVSTDTLTNKTLTTPKIAEIDSLSSGDITLDAEVDINLDAATDVNIPANVGLTFGDDGEKIEGDGTDLTIASSNDLHLTATTDINVPANVGLTFGDDGEKIEGNGTDLTIASSNDLHLTATTDINIPANVGLTFGDDGEKIEGDGTNLTISSSGTTTLDSAGNITIDTGGGDVNWKKNGTSWGLFKESSGDAVFETKTNDKDFVIKGEDGGASVTALTIDMSDAGTAVFNHDIRIANGGQIGSASDADSMSIASNGVVTFSQTPVNSAGTAFVTEDPTALAIALG